ncbi:hypothetical protein [Pollutimonas thiosulfatoxidans]|uniref:Uncharacterized protein n=1 Tax=Pollutimonas thiosulfatoxidans TaxID=2028345 RepID=A0A410GC71_9BURK|nr:hypothetical protein [Pollutimonas thiosulfatoxidans]MBF6617127.1 hypothetical protein [Candidimonas sp.]NYT44545.1 hypothetical protein [Alcaligenaceae bacterium]QAA93869.1 hypothetical protein CKA81_08475 [Pollutimonas thiosulfatoxidans]
MNDALVLVSVLITALAVLTGGAVFLLVVLVLAGMQPLRLRERLHRLLCRISFDCFGRGDMAGR